MPLLINVHDIKHTFTFMVYGKEEGIEGGKEEWIVEGIGWRGVEEVRMGWEVIALRMLCSCSCASPSVPVIKAGVAE